MNKTRRAQILKIASMLDDVKGEIESLQSEEQEYYESMPESIQSGDKGEAAQAAADALTEAADRVEEAVDQLTEAAGD